VWPRFANRCLNETLKSSCVALTCHMPTNCHSWLVPRMVLRRAVNKRRLHSPAPPPPPPGWPRLFLTPAQIIFCETGHATQIRRKPVGVEPPTARSSPHKYVCQLLSLSLFHAPSASVICGVCRCVLCREIFFPSESNPMTSTAKLHMLSHRKQALPPSFASPTRPQSIDPLDFLHPL